MCTRRRVLSAEFSTSRARSRGCALWCRNHLQQFAVSSPPWVEMDAIKAIEPKSVSFALHLALEHTLIVLDPSNPIGPSHRRPLLSSQGARGKQLGCFSNIYRYAVAKLRYYLRSPFLIFPKRCVSRTAGLTRSKSRTMELGLPNRTMKILVRYT